MKTTRFKSQIQIQNVFKQLWLMYCYYRYIFSLAFLGSISVLATQFLTQ